MKQPCVQRWAVAMILALILSFSSIQILIAQEEDDPRYDRVPRWVFDSIANRGDDLRATVVVTVNGYDNFKVGLDFAEGHISQNPKQPTQSFTAFNISASHYTNDGHDFVNSTASWGASMWGDPVTAYDSLGNLYWENMYGAGTVQGCKVVKSSNNGQNWGTSVTAIAGVDKNWICADQTAGPYSNYIYTVMTSSGGGNVARSTDLGATFQNMANLSTQSLPGMMCAVGANGNVQGGAVYVVTNGGSTFNSTYTFYQSTNGGSSFTQKSSGNWAGTVGTQNNGRHSVNNMRTRPYPFIAADNSFGTYRGRLYCVYATNDPAGNGNKPDIFCRYSSDGGSTWSAPVRVNDDANPQSHTQFMPAIWCDKSTGRLYVQWMDTRDTPTSDSALIYATYSDNGGQSFVQNKAVSNQKMKIDCQTCGGSGTPRYQGDYNAITANSATSILTWTDFRAGKFDSYVAYFPDYAMTLTPGVLPVAGTGTFTVNIPSVKHYNSSVIVTATAPTPPAGTITFSFPNGSILNTVPGDLEVQVNVSPEVPVGNYSATIVSKGPNGTPVHKRTLVIQVQPASPPVADFYADNTVVCAGETINFFDQSTNSPTDWEWSFPGGEPETSTDKNPTDIAYNTAGIYDVTLTAINIAGSDTITKTDYITINVVPDPPTSDDEEVCEGDIVPDLVATGDTVKWYSDPELTTLVFEGNVFATGQTEPGTYSYYITETANGCESEVDTVSLTINPLPEVTMQPFDSVCVDLPAFVLTGGAPEGGDYFGNGVTDGSFDPTAAGVGTHTISYAYTNEFGCSDTAMMDITVNPDAIVNLGDDQQFCDGDSVIVDAGVGYIYLWSTGDTTQTITLKETATVSVEVTNEFGCTASDEISVEKLPLPGESSVTGGPVSVDTYLNATSEFTASEGTDVDEYIWSLEPADAGTITGNATLATVTWSATFTGQAAITVKTANECGESPLSAAYNVQVFSTLGIDEGNNELSIQVFPNPNSGTFILEIKAKNEKRINISVVNALGEKIYTMNDVSVSDVWKNTVSLDNVGSGVFVVIIESGKSNWQKKVFINN